VISHFTLTGYITWPIANNSGTRTPIVKYFHIFGKLVAHGNSILLKNTGCDCCHMKWNDSGYILYLSTNTYRNCLLSKKKKPAKFAFIFHADHLQQLTPSHFYTVWNVMLVILRDADKVAVNISNIR
jgi:hypothetical protein